MKNHEEISNKTKETFVELLASQLGSSADVKHIYAEPIERDGVTIVPVAKVRYAFGGGGGQKDGEEGSGGGGGVAVTPIGYIEIKNGETRFRQIIDSASLLSLMAIGSLSLLTIFWGISKLLSASERETQ